MGPLLAELVPFALGLALTPTAIATGILLLGSRRPVADTLAFAAPFALLYTVVAGAVLAASGASSDPLVSEHTKHVASLVTGLALLALAAAGAVRRRRNAGRVAKRGLLERVDSATPAAAFGLGLALAVLNPNVPILLGGLTALAAADVSEAARAGGAAFLVASSEVGLIVPLLWYVVDRERATRGLGRLKVWLGRHEHTVDVVVLTGFGATFTLKGLAGL